MGLIGLFLLIGAWPALKSAGLELPHRAEWLPETGDLRRRVAALGHHPRRRSSPWSSRVPIGFGAALFISEYAPRSLKSPLVTLVDLMAAVPSIVYAMWALFFLQDTLLHGRPVAVGHFGAGCLPFLRVDSAGLALVVHVVGVHRRHRRRRRRAPDRDLDHARGLLAGSDRRARRAHRPRRHPVGDDPHGRDPLRPRRDRRRHHARPRSCTRRDDRGLRDHLADASTFTTAPARRAARTRSPRTSPRATPSRAVSPCPVCSVRAWCCSCSRWSSTPLAGVVVEPLALRRRDGDLRCRTARHSETERVAQPGGAGRAPPSRPPPSAVRIGGADPELVIHVVSAGLRCAAALVWLVYERLLPMSGAIGFWLCWYVVVPGRCSPPSARPTLDRVAVIDRLVGALVTTAGLVLVACLAGIVVFTAVRGMDGAGPPELLHPDHGVHRSEAPLDQGGIFAAIVGTLEQVAISVVLSVPLGSPPPSTSARCAASWPGSSAPSSRR